MKKAALALGRHLSTKTRMTSMISNMISTLSLADKVSLNQVLAASIAKDLGASSAPILEKAKTKGKAKDPNAPKKEAAPGVKAWNAFVKHCKATQPQLFTDIKLEKERLAICGSIKEKDLAAYQAWVAGFLKTLPASAPASAAASAPASDTEETEVKIKVKKEKTPEKKAAESQKRKEKAAAKKVSATPPPAPEEDGDFTKKIIKGKNYLMDPASKNLYSTDDKFMSVGDYVGKFIPGDDTKPIDFDAAE